MELICYLTFTIIGGEDLLVCRLRFSLKIYFIILSSIGVYTLVSPGFFPETKKSMCLLLSTFEKIISFPIIWICYNLKTR